MTNWGSDFAWGAATAAYQVEGDNRGSDWWAWEQREGTIFDGTRSGDGAGWWRAEAEHDLSRAAELGHNAHRLSVEWSRIEPEPGRYDAEALQRYVRLLDHARSVGLSICLTLNHFTLPRWVGAAGWTDPGLPDRFAGLAARCGEAFGDRVRWWATLNEPGVLAQGAYRGTRWPPGLGSDRAARRALRNQLRAHCRGSEMLRQVLPGAKVGLVLALPRYTPDRDHRRDAAVARVHDWSINQVVLEALEHGWLLPPLSMRPRRIPELPHSFDWLGVNYYGRYRVRFAPHRPMSGFGRHRQDNPIRTATSDWGEPDPQGLTDQLLRLAKYRVPLMVTENGVFDCEATTQVDYLASHVAAIGEARRAGADVRGYFWWSLVDNFEWAEGWSTRFGLLALDRTTGRRTPRPSAEAYAEICRENALRL